MKNKILITFFSLLVFAGCATTPATSEIFVWETKDIGRTYEVIGPISVVEEIAESDGMMQGLAAFITKDGRLSDKIPAEMKTAIELRKEKYKEMIFAKLSEKAKKYKANAIIEAEYTYIPALMTLSTKATVSAKGIMVKYK